MILSLVVAGILTVSGEVPLNLPKKLSIGLTEQNGSTWMKDTGVKWTFRYRYFTKGWVNNFGFGPPDGSWGRRYIDECGAQGFIPAVAYYQMNGEPGGGEDQFYNKTKVPATMRGYFSDFAILMQQVKAYGKPVLVMLEADGFAYMQQQSGNNPSAYSAIAATGLPYLAGLPNTAAGWGQAFVQIKRAVGATNAILGMHVSAWADGTDLMYGSGATVDMAPHIEHTRVFLSALGMGSYDVIVVDPLDRDADYHRLVNHQNRWWGDGGVNTQSFSRYSDFLRRWNNSSNKRIVMWQIPFGLSISRNVRNDGSPGSGWKDFRSEFFFGPGRDAALNEYIDNGVIALLFGEGATGQSTVKTATNPDGGSYLRGQVGEFLKAAPPICTCIGGSDGGLVLP